MSYKWRPQLATSGAKEKPFPIYPVFDMDFTLALADVAAEFFKEVAKQNGLPENHFIEKLSEYVSHTKPIHKAIALGKELPEQAEWLKKERAQYSKFYPGWAVEKVFKDMIPNLASGRFKLSLREGEPRRPITRETLVNFARRRIPLVRGAKAFFRELNQSGLISLNDCFIATAGLKPFAEGIAAQINSSAGFGGKMPQENIFGLDVLTDRNGAIYGVSNYHNNEKIDSLQEIRFKVRRDIKRVKKWPSKESPGAKLGNPVAHMVYVGDGITDEKAMRYISSGGRLQGNGMSVQLNPDPRLVSTGMVEFAVVSPSMKYLWKKLIKPYIVLGGGSRAKHILKIKIAGSKRKRKKKRRYHTSLLHRYEIHLGNYLAQQSPERLARVARWRRKYNIGTKPERAKLLASRFLVKPPKRWVRRLAGKHPK